MTSCNSKESSNYNQEKRPKTKRLTTEEFIARAKCIHSDIYNYSLVEYVNLKSKVKIICSVHGVFEMPAVCHLFQKSKCQKCAVQDRSNNRKLTINQFLEKAKIIHGSTYDYSLVDYKNTDEKVKILCDKHGEFTQTPHCHLNRKQGCPSCSKQCKKDTAYFIDSASAIHGNLYSYEKSEYISSKGKVEITCRVHGSFWQTPNAHTTHKQGCPQCGFENTRGWSRSDYVKFTSAKGVNEATLYIIKCVSGDEQFYKVGITHQSISVRFKNKTLMPYDYTIVKQYSDETGFIWDIEKRMHIYLKKYQYNPQKSFGGETECFFYIPKDIEHFIDKMNKQKQWQLIA